MTNGLVPEDIEARYEVHQWRHGLAILAVARPGDCGLFGFLNRKSCNRAEANLSFSDRSTIISRGWAGAKNHSTRRSLWTVSSTLRLRIRWIVSKTEWRWKSNGTTRIHSSTETSITSGSCSSCAPSTLASSLRVALSSSISLSNSDADRVMATQRHIWRNFFRGLQAGAAGVAQSSCSVFEKRLM